MFEESYYIHICPELVLCMKLFGPGGASHSARGGLRPGLDVRHHQPIHLRIQEQTVSAGIQKGKQYFAQNHVPQKRCSCGDVRIFQLVCYTKSGSARSGPRTTTSQASGQSRASQSRTLVTEMVHYRDRGGEQASCSVAQPRQSQQNNISHNREN